MNYGMNPNMYYNNNMGMGMNMGMGNSYMNQIPNYQNQNNNNNLINYDVTEELAEAEDYYLNKKIINYDIKNIMDEQSKPSRIHFKHLIKRIKKVGEENGFI